MSPMEDADPGADAGRTSWAAEEAEATLRELEGVARALAGAPARAESSARAHLQQVPSRPEDRQPWQIGSLEQICRNQAGEVRALARRLRNALGLPPHGGVVPGVDDDAMYARDERD